MDKSTQSAFSNYLANIATINKQDFSVVSSGYRFNVHKDVQVKWVQDCKDQNDFLRSIDVGLSDSPIITQFDVPELGIIGKRTDTSKNRRKGTTIGGSENVEYVTRKVEYDFRIPWEVMDSWNLTNRREFNKLLNARKVEARSESIALIGWHGVKAEKETDPSTNPNGEDVAIGWLQRIRDNAPDQVMSKHPETGEPITIGKGGTYKKVDVLVDQMARSLPKKVRDKLVCYISDDLVDTRQMQIIEDTEGHNVDKIKYALFPIGGLPAETPPGFPDGTILITFPKNLKHRTHVGTERSFIKDMPEEDAVCEFNSANEVYGIGSYECVALAEEITIADEEKDGLDG